MVSWKRCCSLLRLLVWCGASSIFDERDSGVFSLVDHCRTVFGYNFLHVSVVSLDRAVLAISVGLYVVYRVWGYAQPKAWNAGDSMFAGFLGAMVLTTVDPSVVGWSVLKQVVVLFSCPCHCVLGRSQSSLNHVTLRWMYIAFAILVFIFR